MMATARLVTSVVVIFVISAFARPSSRIWGGEEASKSSFPYVASVRLNGTHNCGGSIIGTKWIITAAHCVVENGNIVSARHLTVRVGSTNQFSGGKLHYVSEISVHPDFANLKNDVAILVLEQPLTWTDRIAMINTAKVPTDTPAVGDSVLVAGWGQQSSNVSSHKLHSMSFSVASEEMCSSVLYKDDGSKICLAHDLKKGSCFGDAGNGAVHEDVLVGVSSYIVGACGSRYPDVFSNVLYYAPWIKTVVV